MPEREPADSAGGHRAHRLTTSTGEPAPGERLRVSRRWLDHGLPYVILSRHDGGVTPECLVSWVLKLPHANYVLLRPLDAWWAPDEGPPPEALVGVLQPDVFVALSPTELAEAARQLELSQKERGDWPASRLTPCFRAEVRDVLGELPPKDSPEFRAQDLPALGFTHYLALGSKPVAEGAALAICRRWRVCNRLFLSLAESAGEKGHEFSLSRLFLHQGSAYLVLSYPPDLTGDDDIIPRIVVKALSGDTVVTLSERELREVAVPCIREWERIRNVDPQDAHGALGQFPCLEDDGAERQEESAPIASEVAAPSTPEPCPLTNLVFVPGDRPDVRVVAPLESDLVVVRRWRDERHILLSLSRSDTEPGKRMPERSTDISVYMVERLFRHDRGWYVVLRHLPEFIDPAGGEPHIVLRVESSDHVCTLTDEEVQAIRATYRSDCEGRPEVKLSEVVSGWGRATEEGAGRKTIGPGSRLGALCLVERIGEGSFSWVYRATRPAERDGSSPRAIKIAKPAAYLPPEPRGGPNQAFLKERFESSALHSQGVLLGTGYIGGFQPDPAELLVLQAEKLRAAADDALVTVHEIVCEGNVCWCEMRLIEGATLRDLISAGRAPLAVFIELAWKMERLRRNPAFRHHGDLKPENIMLDRGKVKLIDPGWFAGGESIPAQGVVTSPAYYPTLAPDDLFAVGLILWETALGRHPFFLEKPPGADSDLGSGRSQLDAWVRRFEGVGHYMLKPLRYLPRPLERLPILHAEIEQVLLKALGLGLTEEGKLDRTATEGASGYASFAELAEDLERLRAQGIDYL